MFQKDLQYYKFCFYGFLKNLRFFEAFLLLFFLDNGLSFFRIGLLYAIRELTVNLFEIPSGIIADSIGRRRTMIMAFVFYIISFAVFYISSSFSIFALAMVIFALGEAFRSGNHKAMIMNYLSVNGWSDQKVSYYGHTRSWSQLGSALSALIGGTIVFFTGQYKFIFLCSIVPYVIDLGLVASYPGYLDKSLGKFKKKDIFHEFRTVAVEFWKAIKSIIVLRALANLSIYSGFYKAIKDYLQPVLKTLALSIPFFLYLEDEKRSSLMIGIVFFILHLLTSYASRRSGSFSGRFRHLAIPLNITLIIGFSLGFLSGLAFWINFYLVSVVLFAGIYVVENLRKPIGVAYVSNTVNDRILASTMSADSQAKSMIAAILAPIIGIFADHLGVGVAIMIVSLAMILLLPVYRAKIIKG